MVQERQELTITGAVPWVEDEQALSVGVADEGQLDGTVDGHPVSAHVAVHDHAEWASFVPGRTIPVELWLDREGDVEAFDGPPRLHRLDGIRHAAEGRIVKVLDPSTIVLDVGFPLEVRLHRWPSVTARIPELEPGRTIRMRGTLAVEPDTDGADEPG